MGGVSAVIPAYNEERCIGLTVRAVRQVPRVKEVVVVNDGSADATAEVAAASGAKVITLARNLGKGAALAAGVDATGEDLLLFLDADLGGTAIEAVKLVEPVIAGEADMAIALFPAREHAGGLGLARGLAGWGIRKAAGLNLEAPLSGQRALRREVIRAVGRLARGFGVEVGLTIDAACLGFRVVEVPTSMRHHPTGRDLAGFLHRGKQFLAVVNALAPRLFWGGIS